MPDLRRGKKDVQTNGIGSFLEKVLKLDSPDSFMVG